MILKKLSQKNSELISKVQYQVAVAMVYTLEIIPKYVHLVSPMYDLLVRNLTTDLESCVFLQFGPQN